jgi:predicted small secreted protein
VTIVGQVQQEEMNIDLSWANLFKSIFEKQDETVFANASYNQGDQMCCEKNPPKYT